VSTPAKAPKSDVEPAPPPKPKQPDGKPQAVPKSALELRAARRRILQRRFGIWVGIPTLLAIVYYVFLAKAQYDAVVTLAVESNEGRITDVAGKSPNAGNQRDARLLKEALLGANALSALNHGGAFRAHYKDGDWLTRLSPDAGADEVLDYYRTKVSVTNETNSNITTVHVRAFSGTAAFDFATKLAEFSKTWVDHQNETSSAARIKQAQGEVTRERDHVAAAAAALAKLEQPKPTDPEAIDKDLADKRLEGALKNLQEAQLEVGRAQRYLVVLDGPSQPDSAALPRRAWGILTVAIGALVLVSVLSLLGASVREHAKF
jgi:capsule polysaccharide export protein KpsE/RkpR